MKTVTKLLLLAGAGVAVVALLPYKVSRDETAGKNTTKLRAMTWDMDLTMDEDGVEAKIHMPPTEKLGETGEIHVDGFASPKQTAGDQEMNDSDWQDPESENDKAEN